MELLLSHVVTCWFKSGAAFPVFLHSTAGNPHASEAMGIPEILPHFVLLIERARLF